MLPYHVGLCLSGSRWSLKAEAMLISFYLLLPAPNLKADAP